MIHSKQTKPQTKEKPHYTMWQNSGFMVRLAWQHEKQVLILGLLQAMTFVGCSLISLYITPVILQRVETHAPIGKLISTILIFAGLLLLLKAAQGYLNDNVLYGRISVREALIARLLDKTNMTSYPNLSDERMNRLYAKASEACGSNNEAAEAVWTTLTELLQNSLGFLLYLGLLANLQPVLILVIMVTAASGYYVSKRINSYGYNHREEIGEYRKELYYTIQAAEDQRLAKDIRIFGLKPWIEEVGQKAIHAYQSFRRREAGIYIWSNITDLALAFLRNGAAYGYLLYMALQQNLSASEFLLYFTAVDGFASWISGILASSTTLYRQSIDISSIRDYLEAPEPFIFEEGRALAPQAQKAYELRLDDVSFRYPGADRDTISHLSLTLHPGEKLAVVGLNGAGKTTLIKLMCGFYDPTEGRVLLDDVDIRTYNRRDYYRMFSAVFQQFGLLAGSVAMNVVQSLDSIDKNRVKQCIADAGLKEKIESLPQQYETMLERTVYEDGAMLSGGETQRLMLARALYKNAPIVVLDEPTAALDPLAEEDIYCKYQEMTQGRSSVYISHRLASTRFCDRIILLEQGRIVEEGTHEALLAQGGQYAELFQVQSKYYREGTEHEEI